MLHLKREGALGVGRDEQAAWEAAVLPLYDARNLANKTGYFLHF